MIKIYTFILICSTILFNKVSAKDILPVNCEGLPGCDGDTVKTDAGLNFVGYLIDQGIIFVTVISVVALMLSGVIYILSIGNEEKAKKAKNWILWSLAGVLLSIGAWTIVNLLSSFSLNS